MQLKSMKFQWDNAVSHIQKLLFFLHLHIEKTIYFSVSNMLLYTILFYFIFNFTFLCDQEFP